MYVSDFSYFENLQNDAIWKLIYGMTLVYQQYSLCRINRV